MWEYEIILERMFFARGLEVPSGLKERVDRVNQLVRMSGGGLVSRQVIATIVEAYEREMLQRANFHET